MNIGVLARSQERARHIILTDPYLSAHDSDALIPLSPHSAGYRGRNFDAIFVEDELWPLSGQLREELIPALYRNGGVFYTRG